MPTGWFGGDLDTIERTPVTGWWAETFASITALAQAARAALSGEQPGSASIAATVQRVTAVLEGNQPFTGQVAAAAQPAQASLSGAMAPDGTLAATLGMALFSAAGGGAGQGVLAAAGGSASGALAGTHGQQGTISALLQRATATMVGEQPTAGLLAAAGARASAALVGNQPFTGAMGAQASSATAQLSGGQTQQGALAATLRQTSVALSGTQSAGPLFSSIGTGQAASGTALSWTHTANTGDTVFAGISVSGNGTITSVTYDPTGANLPMTSLGFVPYANNSGFGRLQLFRLDNAPAGPKTISVVRTNTSGATGNTIGYSGVNSVGTLQTVFNTGTAWSQTVTTSAGQVALQMFGGNNVGTSLSNPTGGTNRYLNSGIDAFGRVGALSISEANATTTFTATAQASTQWGGAAVVLS